MPRELVGREATNALLAKHTPAASRQPAVGTGLGVRCSLHPSTEERLQIHAAPVVAKLEDPLGSRHATERDRDRERVGIVRVLDELAHRDHVIADQLLADELEQPGAWTEGD